MDGWVSEWVSGSGGFTPCVWEMEWWWGVRVGMS